MSHTPWTQEQAEKWAMESDVVRKATFEDDAIAGFLAGLQKAAEIIEVKNKNTRLRFKRVGEDNERKTGRHHRTTRGG